MANKRTKTRLPPPRGWWWPLAVCLLFTPVAMWIAVLSYGFGHGDGKADDALFPLHDAMRSLIGAIPAERVMYFGQYPLYGVFLSLAARYRRLLIAVGLLIAFHLACSVWGSAIVDSLSSRSETLLHADAAPNVAIAAFRRLIQDGRI